MRAILEATCRVPRHPGVDKHTTVHFNGGAKKEPCVVEDWYPLSLPTKPAVTSPGAIHWRISICTISLR